MKWAFVRPLLAFLFLSVVALTGCGDDEPPPADTHKEAGSDLDETPVVRMSPETLAEFDIEVATAGPGALHLTLTFPGEVKVNEDHFAHIVPRVSGVVHSVDRSVGDRVRAGDVLAVLDSRELADLKAMYLANLERLDIAASNYWREETLFGKKITSEQEYLEARQALTEARIALRSVRQKLLALGFSEAYIDALAEQPEHALVHYELTAPIAGVVVEKHVSQGEALNADADAFAIADLRTVWVDLNVFQKDLDFVREGQQVALVTTGGQLRGEGVISYVRPIVGEETRTAIARIVLPNPDGRWRPGLFVNGTITVDAVEVPMLVPKSAVITMGGDTVIFVETPEGFVARPVTLGRGNEAHVEITSGLKPGDRYVARGGFALKAELEKDQLDEGHAH
ncbi:efflux RND transporter periplasmic adaptor subunit [Rhodocaloribacter litoris]|uniref:efflux RND transporter periplasmic adaptor subunit n=1 Tax=Rhodocaloribacter litoris TaxID=2558931 RepID=UPI00142488FE|nr:efflux RND transporter periplasmic adaptor subunit [Rhodocaloribacter litoris]QXD13789.1 efflux RND transporter periplasmic adaptor subunit [Rhodocaloribacter litoris]